MAPVQSGQVYTEGGPRVALWEVVQVIAPPSGLVHVRLRERTSRRLMLLSCRHLLDRFRLHTVAAPAALARPSALPIAAAGAITAPRPPVPYIHDDAARREVA